MPKETSSALVKETAGETKAETVSYEKNAAGETVMKKAEFDGDKSKCLSLRIPPAPWIRSVTLFYPGLMSNQNRFWLRQGSWKSMKQG
jgi:hypothetical protein